MFKINLPFFTVRTVPRRYAAMLDMGLFTPQYQPKPMNQNTEQNTIENKLACPEKYELQRVFFSKKAVDKLKEELLSPGASPY